MAVDNAPVVEPESNSRAYISPAADFLLLAGLTTVIALTFAAVMIP